MLWTPRWPESSAVASWCWAWVRCSPPLSGAGAPAKPRLIPCVGSSRSQTLQSKPSAPATCRGPKARWVTYAALRLLLPLLLAVTLTGCLSSSQGAGSPGPLPLPANRVSRPSRPLLRTLMRRGDWPAVLALLAAAHNYIDALERDGNFVSEEGHRD